MTQEPTVSVTSLHDSIKENPIPNTKLCPKCNLTVANEFFDRHTAIHNVAEKYSEKEILANIAITTTEIKTKLDEFLRIKTFEYATKRSR